MKKILFCTFIFIVFFISIVLFFNHSVNLKSPNKSSISLVGINPELIHEEDGKTYYVVDGSFYQLKGDSLKFIGVLYDPDYYKKNYVTENGIVYQIDPETGTRYKTIRYFEDGFENAEKLEDLFTENRWHTSNVDPKREGQENNYYNLGNRTVISEDTPHIGKNSLKFQAFASNKTVSKSSIYRGIMHYKSGDDVYFSGWYYFKDTPDLYDNGGLTIFDIETTWTTASMGIRLIIRENDALSFELEFPKTQFRQEKGKEVPFPTGKWVHVKGQVHLSVDDGFVKLWQDDVLILDKKGRTLPLTSLVYNSVETGISAIAKGSKYSQTLYVDDFIVSNKPIK